MKGIYRSALDFVVKVVKYASLVLAAFTALVPVVVCVITAFKTDIEYRDTNVMVPPHNWLNFTNFQQAWQKANMNVAFLNSTLILIFVLAGSILFGTMLAYVLSRFRFKGNKLIRNLFLFASLIPGIAMQVTVYQIMYQINFIDKLYGYIILMMGTDIISIYIFIQFFENISKSLDESAIIDGASYFRIFFQILFPLLKPAIVTVLILKGVSTYNEYYCANLYLQSKDRLVTVATSLYKFTGPLGSQYNLICAGVIITIIPAVIIFLLCQKQIYAGLTIGSVKGD
jgi:multiple sugar transport system permease protein